MKNGRWGFLPGIIMGAVFIILRLTGATDWNWWAVTAPLWATVIVGPIVYGLCYLFLRLVTRSKETSDRVMHGAYSVLTAFVAGVIFIVLRLVGLIDWSWWAITAPFWGAVVVGPIVYGVSYFPLRIFLKSKETIRIFWRHMYGGLYAITGAVFIILRLTGVIGWNWWLVVAPLLLSAGFLFGLKSGIRSIKNS